MFMRDTDYTYSAEEIEHYLWTLGNVLNKQDITDTSATLAEYLVGVKGFECSEEFMHMELGDLEEAKTNTHLRISDASVKTVHRYMTYDGPLQAPPESGDNVSMGDSANSNVTTGISARAEDALLKIAGSAPGKAIPELKGMLTVKKIKDFLKSYANFKKNMWKGTGLYEALMSIRKSPHRPAEDLYLDAAAMLTTPIEIDNMESAEFMQAVADKIVRQTGMAEVQESILQSAIKILKHVVDRSYNELLGDLKAVVQ